MIWESLALKVGLPIVTGLLKSNNKKDIHGGSILKDQQANLERIVTMQEVVEQGGPNLDDNYKKLFAVISAEMIRSCKDSIKSVAMLTEENIDIDPMIAEIEEVVKERFSRKSTPEVV